MRTYRTFITRNIFFFKKKRHVSEAGLAVCIGSWTFRKERVARRKRVARKVT